MSINLNIEENYLNIYEQVDAKEKQDAQYKRDLGKCKTKFLSQHLNMLVTKVTLHIEILRKEI